MQTPGHNVVVPRPDLTICIRRRQIA